MGFWNKVGKFVETAIEVAPEIMETMQQEAVKKQASIHQEAERRIKVHERKVRQAEKSDKMSNADFARKVKEEREKLNKYYHGSSQPSINRKTMNGEATYNGLTVSEWNQKWMGIGSLEHLSAETLRRFNKVIGLYKMVLNGQVVYVGKAIEFSNGGFRKRIRDYGRESNSGRTHGSGIKINENLSQLKVSILIVGSTAADVKIIEALEIEMINYLRPIWNVQHNR